MAEQKEHSIRLVGLETEYGIAREDLPTADPVIESMELVRAYLDSPFVRQWDYRGEHPHEDQRGFRVQELAQDREETEFAKQDAHRPFSFFDMKSDLMLSNGARFYNDHTHPEYSTPECRSLFDLVAHDRAGERIVWHAATKRNRELGGPVVQLYKNNTDFHGHSYGCHDNYLVSRQIPFETLARGLMPFLVSRQILAGAGKVGTEAQEGTYRPGPFQISQRADFMETDLSVDTMHNRPILNTRDEPHANPQRFRRLHLILGDANMCEYATAMKVGTTRVVLDMIAAGYSPTLVLENPVQAIQTISQDPTLQARVPRQSGAPLTALDIQRHFLEDAKKWVSDTDEETSWILGEWENTLHDLTHDRLKLVGKIDWITKWWMLDSFSQEEGIGWDDPWLTSLDLEYHNLDPERSLFRGLEAEGRIASVCTEDQITRAIQEGPEDTRAGIRGLCVQRFREHIKSVQWEHMAFKDGEADLKLDLSDHIDPTEVYHCRKAILKSTTPKECLAIMKATAR